MAGGPGDWPDFSPLALDSITQVVKVKNKNIDPVIEKQLSLSDGLFRMQQ